MLNKVFLILTANDANKSSIKCLDYQSLVDVLVFPASALGKVDEPKDSPDRMQERTSAKAVRNRVRQLLDDAGLTNTPVQFCNLEWVRYGGCIGGLA